MYQRAAVRHFDCVRVSCGLLNYTVRIYIYIIISIKNIKFNTGNVGNVNSRLFTVNNVLSPLPIRYTTVNYNVMSMQFFTVYSR